MHVNYRASRPIEIGAAERVGYYERLEQILRPHIPLLKVSPCKFPYKSHSMAFNIPTPSKHASKKKLKSSSSFPTASSARASSLPGPSTATTREIFFTSGF